MNRCQWRKKRGRIRNIRLAEIIHKVFRKHSPRIAANLQDNNALFRRLLTTLPAARSGERP